MFHRFDVCYILDCAAAKGLVHVLGVRVLLWFFQIKIEFFVD